MSGSPKTQTFKVQMNTSLTASFLSANDVIGYFNAPGSAFWNGVIGGALTLEDFSLSNLTGLRVSSSSSSNSNGNATLSCTLTTVSDPATADSIQQDILLAGGLIAIAVGAAFALIRRAGWAADLVGLVLAFAGVLVLLSVGVTETTNAITGLLGTTAGKILVYGGAIVVGGLLVFGVYQYVSNPRSKKECEPHCIEHIEARGGLYGVRKWQREKIT